MWEKKHTLTYCRILAIKYYQKIKPVCDSLMNEEHYIFIVSKYLSTIRETKLQQKLNSTHFKKVINIIILLGQTDITFPNGNIIPVVFLPKYIT